jgi:hypothetical protein
MTDDIVTRLREHQNPHYPLDEAADEIERLRADSDRWRLIAYQLAFYGSFSGDGLDAFRNWEQAVIDGE